MSIFSSPRFLRNVLLADALSCIACGVLQVFLHGTVTPLLGLGSSLVMGTGIFLLLYGVAVGLIALRDPLPRGLVWLLVVGNIGWGALCAILLLNGMLQPTMLGMAYVIVQAVTVLLLADLQWFGLWRTAPRRMAMA